MPDSQGTDGFSECIHNYREASYEFSQPWNGVGEYAKMEGGSSMDGAGLDFSLTSAPLPSSLSLFSIEVQYRTDTAEAGVSDTTILSYGDQGWLDPIAVHPITFSDSGKVPKCSCTVACLSQHVCHSPNLPQGWALSYDYSSHKLKFSTSKNSEVRLVVS